MFQTEISDTNYISFLVYLLFFFLSLSFLRCNVQFAWLFYCCSVQVFLLTRSLSQIGQLSLVCSHGFAVHCRSSLITQYREYPRDTRKGNTVALPKSKPGSYRASLALLFLIETNYVTLSTLLLIQEVAKEPSR